MSELLKKKKHITVITTEFRTYWEQLFLDNKFENPIFHAKLCYQGSEFEKIDGKKSECVRFYSSELSKNQDIFIELYDWNDNPYEEGYRMLYRLKNNIDWKSTPNFCTEVTLKSDGTPLPTPTYAVRVSDLELLSKNKIETAYPKITNISIEEKSLNTSSVDFESLSDEVFKEKEDNHYAQMTIRDIYCIINNVPLSNKTWLNCLIEDGKKWQK